MIFRYYIVTIVLAFSVFIPLSAAEPKIEPVKTQVITKNKSGQSDDSEDYFGVVQLALYAPVQIIPEDYAVYGLKLGLPYSANKTLVGLDLGLCNQVTETHYGLSCAGLLSLHSGQMYGVNLSGIMNLSDANETGLTAAALYNEIKATVRGLQLAALVNQAYSVKGVQIGLVNYTRNLAGVQIGLINFCKNQPFRFTFFINAWNK